MVLPNSMFHFYFYSFSTMIYFNKIKIFKLLFLLTIKFFVFNDSVNCRGNISWLTSDLRPLILYLIIILFLFKSDFAFDKVDSRQK